MRNQYWSGFFTTFVFVFTVALILGGMFLIVSLLAGTPGA
jgi:hypothetical protein